MFFDGQGENERCMLNDRNPHMLGTESVSVAVAEIGAQTPLIRFCCDACGRRLRSPVSTEGKRGRCVCGEPVLIPFCRHVPSEDNPLRGFCIAGCRIDRVVGAGSFATVYKGHHLRLDIPVAIKVLHPERAAARHRETFLEEARVIAIINHRNVVQVLDAGRENDLLYIIMRYIRGKSLGTIIRTGEQLCFASFLKIAMDTARALQASHKLSIVHGDVKPAHILVTPRRRAILIDFGMASLLSEYRKKIYGYRAMGTPLYMSPEQARGDHDVDFRVDIYALGATMYHALAGRPPFEGSFIDILKAHEEKTPDPLDKIIPGIPRAMADVIAKAMAKKPGDRYQSMDALKNDLLRIAKLLTCPTT